MDNMTYGMYIYWVVMDNMTYCMYIYWDISEKRRVPLLPNHLLLNKSPVKCFSDMNIFVCVVVTLNALGQAR